MQDNFINQLKSLTKDFFTKDKIKLLNFLNSIDIDIKDFILNEEEDKFNIKTIHEKNGIKYELNYLMESDGTRKIIDVFYIINIILDSGGLLIYDELDKYLHPLLLKKIIDMFNTNKNNAQIIFSAHDITFLDKKYFRRDQIFLTEKKDQESTLFSLADFKIRKDLDFKKNYLAGVFGAVPSIKIINDFMGVDDEQE